MSSVRIAVQAPSNIALVKYMGKKESSLANLPANPSISMTLKSLCTYAEMEVIGEGSSASSEIRWVPELPRIVQNSYPASVPHLKEQDVLRISRHIKRVQSLLPEVFQRSGLEMKAGIGAGSSNLGGLLRTANTFPASSGIASSASSFAAVTLATAIAFARSPTEFHQAWDKSSDLQFGLARISRQGSGSSCRSFIGPWVLWEEEEISSLAADLMPAMAHFVILIRTQPKKVSSSDAHQAVRTSSLWPGRVERVLGRADRMTAALKEGDLKLLSQICWAEAWEMHSLFHTSSEPFSYWEPGTIEALHWLASFLKEPSPPLVTLDAGPNIHVLVRKECRELWRERLKSHYLSSQSVPQILEDEQGTGPTILKIESGDSLS